LKQAEERLYEKFIAKPLEMLGVMEDAVKAYVIERKQQFFNYDGVNPWQICIQSDENPKRLREIESRLVNSVFTVSGIIISCTKPYIKASELKLKCRNCLLSRTIKLAPGQNPVIPMFCTGQNNSNQKCPTDPFVALPESLVIDTQSLKIQENP
jgi:DNA replication licensing factor MCM5